MTTARHMDPIEDAARHYDAIGDRADASAAAHEAMSSHVLSQIMAGNDEVLPYVGPRGPRWLNQAGENISEHLTDLAFEDERAALFNLLHLALNRDNLEAIHAAALDFAQQIADEYADLYTGQDD